MPTIRVDKDVYTWLQGLATPFDDNPNSVLRKVAGLANRNNRRQSRAHQCRGQSKGSG